MHRYAPICSGLALAVACGGQVEDTPLPEGSDADGGLFGVGGGSAWQQWDGGSITDWDAQQAALQDVRSDYVEPICPDAGPPPVLEECELFASYSTCPSGQACYPFVQYPDPDDNCAQEVYGTICADEGYATQGEPCSAGDCAGGHMCVLTGEGTQCVELCPVFGENTCPPGFICTPIDVAPGIGGCY
jgi:hypothetical protein